MKKRYIRIKRDHLLCIMLPADALDDLSNMIESGNVGDYCLVSIIEMTEQQFNQLPTFQGW